ncbi:MAG: hypothetical protein JNL82_39075 [Myxococcales bacterium]|nr:hypothetical protein [Myxococcales bacterium]
MRRATRATPGQLELPGLPADPTPDVPEPQRAAACARCGWYRAPAEACPVCRHAPARPDRPR